MKTKLGKEPVTVEELYTSGDNMLSLENFKKFEAKFKLTCVHCRESEIAFITEQDNDGYCETCSSPYARVTIKCKTCGQAISIRS